MRKLSTGALAATLFVLLVAPGASGHNTVSGADDTLCITIGHTNEPVTTYVRSGLDLIIRTKLDPAGGCSGDNRGDEVAGFHNGITAALLVAPGGETLDLMPLSVQHGSVGHYTGATPYTLTEPGQYVLRVEGSWEGHDVTGDYDVSGEVPGVEPTYFPALPAGSTMADMQARMAAMDARIAAMDARMEGMDGGMKGQQSEDSAGVAPLALAGSLLVAALVLRRRA